MKYDSEMERELEFYVNPKDAEPSRQHNRFAKLTLVNETHNSRLGLANLIDNGLKGAPQGAVILSKKENEDLLKYIISNF